MQWTNWTFLDFLFIVIVVVSMAFAVTKGLAREIISLVALLGGFFLSVFLYKDVGANFASFTKTEAIANCLGFLCVFLGSIALGALAAFLVNRFLKATSLEWLDRVLGGLYGLIRGWAIASIIVLAVIAFPLRENMVSNSALAPFLLAGARAASLAVPGELKEKFREEYRKLLDAWNKEITP